MARRRDAPSPLHPFTPSPLPHRPFATSLLRAFVPSCAKIPPPPTGNFPRRHLAPPPHPR